MDIALLASGAINLLIPFLRKAGDTLAQKAGEEIFKRLQAHFAAKPGLQEALGDLQQQPDDPDRSAAARVQLRKLLESDPDLARHLERILEESQKGTGDTHIINQKAGDNAIQIGEVNGSVNLTRKP